MTNKISVIGFGVVMALATVNPSQAQTTRPFVHLETAYEYADGATNIGWITCGYTSGGDGCYGSGNLGPFGSVCAVGRANSVVVVIDAGATTSTGQRSPAKMYIYREAVGNGFLTQPFVSPTVTLIRTIQLDVTAKSKSKCQLAISNDTIAFALLGQSVTRVDRKSYSFNSSSADVISISASSTSVIVNVPGAFYGSGYYSFSGGAGDPYHVLTNYGDGISK